MRIVFTYWDGGNGHLSRVAYLAELLSEEGHKCLIVTSLAKSGKVMELAPAARIEVVENRPNRIENAVVDRPLYSHAFHHAQRRLALGFSDSQFILQTSIRIAGVISAFEADIIINDYHDIVKLASEITSVPVLSIAMSHGLTTGVPLGYWKVSEADGRASLECLDSFNIARECLGLDPYRDERETFEGQINAVPTCPPLDPLFVARDSDVYVGPIASAPNRSRSWNKDPNRRPLVVSFLAEGNNRPYTPYPRLLSKVVTAKKEIEFAVLGEEHRYSKWFAGHKSFYGVVPPQRFMELLERADLVITAGGTTLVHALERLVPVLCLPWTSSEAAWGVQAEKHGAGLLHPAYRQPLEWRIDPQVHSRVAVAGHWSLDMTASGLGDLIGMLLDTESYHRASAELGSQLYHYRHSTNIINLLYQLTR
ncbi:hypothetical protein ACWEKT_37430 [Nocardia takedensis]